MPDELDTRIRSLAAERQRPERLITLPDLISELVATLYRLFVTAPDTDRKGA